MNKRTLDEKTKVKHFPPAKRARYELVAAPEDVHARRLDGKVFVPAVWKYRALLLWASPPKCEKVLLSAVLDVELLQKKGEQSYDIDDAVRGVLGHTFRYYHGGRKDFHEYFMVCLAAPGKKDPNPAAMRILDKLGAECEPKSKKDVWFGDVLVIPNSRIIAEVDNLLALVTEEYQAYINKAVQRMPSGDEESSDLVSSSHSEDGDEEAPDPVSSSHSEDGSSSDE